MTRRIAALLCCLVLLFSAALAENDFYRIRTAYDFTPENAAEMWRLLGQREDSDLTDAVSELFSNLRMEFGLGADAADFDLTLKTRSLFHFKALQDAEGAMRIQTSLWPGYQLVQKPFSDGAEKKRTPVDPARYIALGRKTIEMVNELLQVPSEPETGSFAGDAYSGGVKRSAKTVDSRDFAAIMRKLIREYPDYLQILADISGLDQAEIIDSIEARLAEMEWDNSAHVRIVETIGPDGSPAGYSFTVWEKDLQTMTLSLGVKDGKGKAVLSFGAGAKARYLEAEWKTGEKWQGWPQISLRLRMLCSDTGLDYLLLKDNADACLMEAEAVIGKDEETGALTWRGSFVTNPWQLRLVFPAQSNLFGSDVDETVMEVISSQAMISVPRRVRLKSEGRLDLATYDLKLKDELYLGNPDRPLITASVTGGWDEAPVIDEKLPAIVMENNSVEASQQQELNEALVKGLQQLAVNLMMTMPPYLMRYFTPVF